MANLTALEIVQAACGEIGIVAPTVGFTNTDPQVIQLCALLNRSGRDLFRRHNWRRLAVDYTFTTVATEEQTGCIPSDYDRMFPDAIFNRTTTRKVYGSLTEEDWQKYKAYPVYTSVSPAYIVREGELYLSPAPEAGQTLAFGYVKNTWALSAASVPQTKFSADTDTARLDDDLLTLDLIWRWKRAKGFDYAEEFATFEQEYSQVAARDAPSSRLNQTFGLNRWRWWPYNVVEGNYPGNGP